jgi:plastocyanin
MSTEKEDYQPNGKIWFLVILVSMIFAGSLYYFGKIEGIDSYQAVVTNGANTRQARIYTVYYNVGVFSPTNIRIHAGDSVKFQNDSSEYLHVTSDVNNGILDLIGFDSIGNIPPKGIFAFTFTEAGSFGYHNELNKTERGMVIVRP